MLVDDVHHFPSIAWALLSIYHCTPAQAAYFTHFPLVLPDPFCICLPEAVNQTQHPEAGAQISHSETSLV